MGNPIKKPSGGLGLVTTSYKLNFKSEQEIIKAYEIGHELDWIDSQRRRKRFEYYLNVFDLKESWLLDELTDKEAEQYSLIWKLVDLEDSKHG